MVVEGYIQSLAVPVIGYNTQYFIPAHRKLIGILKQLSCNFYLFLDHNLITSINCNDK